jgi:hypothetical protein
MIHGEDGYLTHPAATEIIRIWKICDNLCDVISIRDFC